MTECKTVKQAIEDMPILPVEIYAQGNDKPYFTGQGMAAIKLYGGRKCERITLWPDFNKLHIWTREQKENDKQFKRN